MIEIELSLDIDIPSLIDGDQDWSVLEENGYSKGIPEKIEIQAPENMPEIKITYPEIYGYKTPEFDEIRDETGRIISQKLKRTKKVFKVQINWGHPNLENDWSTVGESPTLERALKKLEYDSGLARIVAPLRVIDEANYVYARYNPELDWRLPGCLWRRTQERAYQLWEKSNKNESSDYYWMLANQQLLEEKNEGILEGDFTQEELKMYEWKTKRIEE